MVACVAVPLNKAKGNPTGEVLDATASEGPTATKRGGEVRGQPRAGDAKRSSCERSAARHEPAAGGGHGVAAASRRPQVVDPQVVVNRDRLQPAGA